MLHHHHHTHFQTLKTFLPKNTSNKLHQTYKPYIVNYQNTPPQKMEIEVKIRLPNKEAHKTLLSHFAPYHIKTHNQHNHFFDGISGELSGKRAVLRLRFYDDPIKAKCVLSLKAKAVLVNGVSRVQEDEEEIDIDEGKRCLSDANRLRMLVGVSRIMTRVKNEYFSGENEKGQFPGQFKENDPCAGDGLGKDPTGLRMMDGESGSVVGGKEGEFSGENETGQKLGSDPGEVDRSDKDAKRLKLMDRDFGFVGLGGFKNVRNVYEWKGLVIEVDETSYEFGTLYEIECESVEPEKAKELIEEFLKENGIEHQDSVMSKFAIFRAGKLP